MRRWVVVWLLLAWEVATAAYVPPVEGAAPFRRDRLPVDVSTMVDLSSHLVTLAGRLDGSEATDARGRAQLIALALALDPANLRARELSERLEEGGEPRPPDGQRLKLARNRAWNLLGWLEQPEAGEDGQALGSCLSDVLAKSDPDHPGASKRSEAERGAWDGWVADLAAFRKPVETPDAESGASDPDGETPEEASSALLVLRKASVRVPLWIVGRPGQSAELQIVPLEVRAVGADKNQGENKEENGGESGPGPGLRVTGPYPSGSGRADRAGPRLTRALEARHGPLPEGLTLRFSLPGDRKPSSRNEGAATGAMVVAADALFTGVEPTGIVLAAVGESGDVVLPATFWEMLRVLADDPEADGRLIVPQPAWELLPYLLTLDQAEFFMRREVLLAADVDAMVTLASGIPPERLPDATEAFEQIRQARGSRSLGSFVNTDAVRTRLEAIARSVPEHASARVLALRGTSRWPQRLERSVYAREVRASLDPMREVLSRRWEDLTVRALQDAEQACRERLKRVERLSVSVDDRTELHDDAVNAVKGLSGLISDLRRRTEFFDVFRAVRPAVRSYVETVKRLTAAVGDGDVYPIPFSEDPD